MFRSDVRRIQLIILVNDIHSSEESRIVKLYFVYLVNNDPFNVGHVHSGPHIDIYGEIKLLSTFSVTPAQFGKPPLCDRLRLINIEPPDACTPIKSNVKNAYIIVQRGGCTFPNKARMIQAAGGVGMLLINHNDDVFSMSGSEETGGSQPTDIYIPSVMVSKSVGDSIVKLLRTRRLGGIYANIVISSECFNKEGLFHSLTDIGETLRLHHADEHRKAAEVQYI